MIVVVDDASVVVPDAPSVVVRVVCPAAVAATVATGPSSFMPTAIVISVGDVVRFAPESPHDARSGTPGAPGDLFTVDGGAPACVRFDEAGTYPFYCQAHPTMTGVVTVDRT